MLRLLLHLLRRVTRLAALTSAAASVGALIAVGLGPRTGHYRVATVLSASMRAAIPAGSLAVVTPMATAESGPIFAQSQSAG